MLAGPRAAHFTRAHTHAHSSLIDLPTVQLNWKHSNTIYRHVCTHRGGGSGGRAREGRRERVEEIVVLVLHTVWRQSLTLVS